MSHVEDNSNIVGSFQDQLPISQDKSQGEANASCSKSISESKKRKIVKERSNVWEHFTKFNSSEGEKMSKCNYCGKNYHSDTKLNGTTTLCTHLSRCPKVPRDEGKTQTQLVLQPNSKGVESSGDLKAWRFDQETVRKALAVMVIVDELPFKHVEGHGFKHFMSACCPMFQIPSRWTLTRDSFQFYLDEKVAMKKFFKDSIKRVCLTTDTWTSIQRVNYMCLTAHYIDDSWKLNKRVIIFCPIYSHRGEVVGQELEKCLIDWEINAIFIVTVDNASSNNGIINHLQKKFSKRDGSILECKHLHMRCVAHIVNLIVQDGIKQVGSSVHRVRSAVRFIRQSPSRLKKFKECVEIEKIQSKSLLILDVQTRWNSTYLMLNTALKFQKAFKRYEEVDLQFRVELEKEDDANFGGVPSEIDWGNARRLISFLEKFYELTLRISGSLYVTSNTFFHEIAEIQCLLQNWETHEDLEVVCMAKKMKLKFDKYWGCADKMPINIYLAVVLDPRFKLRYVEFAVMDIYPGSEGITLAHTIRSSCYDMFHDYKVKSVTQNILPSSNEISHSFVESPNDSRDGGRKYMMVEKFRRFNHGRDDIESKTDLEKYLAEDSENMQEGFDILAWWKVNAARFPILSQMARDILAIPISTVASESTFSTGGRVLDAFRSSLSPKIVQSLICAQDWMRAKWTSEPINVEENIRDIDKIDEDLSKITLDAASW